ncbi:37S ribosomal protein mrp4 [Penicillium longicatenatum]|uniref:37S ribosomal protein mrp4 n=1 Tax=Penicillium longicatenatum TaxID=1561947 RepID=UPI002548F703|nr:37S ribosomal protein mrp4 [Penicillium longicatenatum]KAJ5650196.1 37S ribosomal protein mrp4 [Penicillium longicatenatum]
MIVRQLGVRQSRQLLALSRRAPVYSRSLSSDAPVDTAVQTSSSTPIPEPTKAPRPPTKRQAWKGLLESKAKFNSLGSTVKEDHTPDILQTHISASDVTLELLLAAGTHMGHSTSRWNPQNSRYIFGIREGIHIISLDITAAYLRRAAKVVEEVAARGGIILFVGTRKGQKPAVVRAAELARGYHIFERWIPGSLTNGQQILGHCETKVVNAVDETLPEFKIDLADRPSVKPDLVVCLNPLENVVLLHECGLNNVPTVGIVDTDADPTRLTYPIPANDDSLQSVALIASVLGSAGGAGQKRRLGLAEQGELTYKPITSKQLKLDPFTGELLGAENQK